ncbi:aminotransferase class III-fold pyridoxal phosphate-dependent enzyme [Phyllobacterium zundukense]|uniref:aminotransferase class III-fold pyridoxal phosphate-dependent enzyme n=1 Tax=Phyllobacterium zundukense TaxID=1867719 RepID=UPI003965C712
MFNPAKSHPNATNQFIHPFTQLAEVEDDGPNVIVSGKGVTVTDCDGRELLDGFAGLWCVNIGYGRSEVIEAAQRQMSKLPYASSFFGFANEPALQLAEELVRLSPESLQHVFFTLGGSDAVDSTLKTIRYFFNVTGRPEKKHVIGLERGYHGVSSTGAGLTGLTSCHRFFDLPLPNQHHIPSHYRYRSSYGVTDAEIISGSVAALETKVTDLGGSEKVAAFFCEPVQGSGGVIVPPEGWLAAMRDACAKLDILFVVDEVITGFGRTGQLFACDWERVEPDIMIIAKGLTSGYSPMGAVLMNDEIYRALVDKVPRDLPFAHGFTYTGHPVSAAVALACLEIYERERLPENSKVVGAHLLNGLDALREHPWVGDVRGKGLLAAIELVANRETRESFDPRLNVSQLVRRKAYENGLIVRAFSDNVIGLAPPLVVGEGDIDQMLDRLARAICAAQTDLREA